MTARYLRSGLSPVNKLLGKGGDGASTAFRIAPGVETFVEVNKHTVRPKLFAHFLAGDYFSRPLQQHGEDAEGLLLQRYPSSAPVELSRRRVGLE